MKKILLGIMAVSTIALTGCAKGISKEEAIKYATDNFATGIAALKKDVEGTFKTDIKEATGMFEFMKDLGGEETKIVKAVAAADAEDISAYAALEYKFSLDGDNLIAEGDLSRDAISELIPAMKDVPQSAVDGSAKEFVKFNKEGFVLERRNELKFKVSFVLLGSTIEGSLNVSGVDTYKI